MPPVVSCGTADAKRLGVSGAQTFMAASPNKLVETLLASRGIVSDPNVDPRTHESSIEDVERSQRRTL